MKVAEQNFIIAKSIEHAERVVAVLVKQGIGVISLDIGRYSQPVIRIHYSPACERLKADGFCQNPDSHRGVLLTRARLQGCLLLWDEPMPLSIQTAVLAVH